MRMPFGKHRGEEISELPDEYLAWLFENADLYGALQVCVEKEYWDRFDPEPPPPPPRSNPGVGPLARMTDQQRSVAIKIVESGYRTLALKNHPDAGGDHRAMTAINLAVEVLREALGKTAGGP